MTTNNPVCADLTVAVEMTNQMGVPPRYTASVCSAETGEGIKSYQANSIAAALHQAMQHVAAAEHGADYANVSLRIEGRGTRGTAAVVLRDWTRDRANRLADHLMAGGQ